MKSPQYAYQILSCRETESGAFFVRRVEIVAVYPLTRTAGVKVTINRREWRGFASFDDLASSKAKAFKVIMARLENFPGQCAAAQVAATGSENKTPAAVAA